MSSWNDRFLLRTQEGSHFLRCIFFCLFLGGGVEGGGRLFLFWGKGHCFGR